jgi:asparagine synthase (glutamine-hydrolysing)
MGGIAGIVRFDGGPVDSMAVERMATALAHRGPDGLSAWTDHSAALVYAKLATSREAVRERQPIVADDGPVALVMHGRLDWPQNVRRELQDVGARTDVESDAELVLAAYRRWGEACVAHLEGDFAFVVWDARRRAVYAVRDRLGIKPLYYAITERELLFASEITALLASCLIRRVQNEGMLAEYLAGEWLTREETLWSGVRRLPAAHALVMDTRGARRTRYWLPRFGGRRARTSDQEHVERYKHLLFEQVRCRTRSHQLIGCELSGGLDSSAVLAVAAELRRQGRLDAPSLQAYTLDFSGDAQADEVDFARAAAEYAGVPCTAVLPSRPPVAWFVSQARTGAPPDFPNAVMFGDLRRRFVADGGRVLLTGEGGDQWLGGDQSAIADELYHGHWRAAARLARAEIAATGWRSGVRHMARRGLRPLLGEMPAPVRSVIQASRRLRRPARPEPAYWLAPRLQRLLADRRFERDRQQRAWRSSMAPAQASLFATLEDAQSAMITESVERLASANGVELRHPFDNAAMVQWAFDAPERLRSAAGARKIVHVEAMRGLLPDVVRLRYNKAEFSSVFRDRIEDILQGLQPLARDRFGDLLSQPGWARLSLTYQQGVPGGWTMWMLWGSYIVLQCRSSTE